MALHVFASIVTKHGVASNNRGENEGNTTTLQKLIWYGEPHTTVSAEAIRFALRRRLYEQQTKGTNGQPASLHRWWDEAQRVNMWRDFENGKISFENWCDYADDDLLGYMATEEAEKDGGRGSAKVRRAVLEMTRAVSLTSWSGDVVFNAASPRATPAAAKGEGDNPVPYAAEIHATRYQYGLAMTPEHLSDPTRATLALLSLARLGEVAGNHARFLFDFSPDSIILRLTDDPAPRLLYCFETSDNGKTVDIADDFKCRVGKDGADIRGEELIIGGLFASTAAAKALEGMGAKLFPHRVNAAVQFACNVIRTLITKSNGDNTIESPVKNTALAWNHIKQAISAVGKEMQTQLRGEAPEGE